jgi:hypothetical protein
MLSTTYRRSPRHLSKHSIDVESTCALHSFRKLQPQTASELHVPPGLVNAYGNSHCCGRNNKHQALNHFASGAVFLPQHSSKDTDAVFAHARLTCASNNHCELGSQTPRGSVLAGQHSLAPPQDSSIELPTIPMFYTPKHSDLAYEASPNVLHFIWIHMTTMIPHYPPTPSLLTWKLHHATSPFLALSPLSSRHQLSHRLIHGIHISLGSMPGNKNFSNTPRYYTQTISSTFCALNRKSSLLLTAVPMIPWGPSDA